MRLFFAIEFNDKLKKHLFNIQEVIRQYCTGGNFTSKDNFHLTLRFIGEQSPCQAEKLLAAMRATAKDFKPKLGNLNISEVETETNMVAFQLRLNTIGKFDRGNKKILWVGLDRSQELQFLYDKLESNLLNYGYAKEERGYNPHITLAREVRIEEFDKLKNIVQQINSTINVNSISLMESKRINNKLCYVPLERAQLK